MSISQNSKITWTDVKAIYTNLNKPTEDRSTSGTTAYYGGRQAFGFSNVTIPEKQYKSDTLTDLTLLNNFIKEMSSNSFLRNIATGVTLPSKGAKLQPSFLSSLNQQVTNINNTCVFNPFASCFGFNGSFFESCFGFNGSFFTSCFGFDGFSFDGFSFDGFTARSSFDSNGSCFGACWGQCFIDNDKMSCFDWSGPSLAGCFGGGFTCSERGSCCSASDFS